MMTKNNFCVGGMYSYAAGKLLGRNAEKETTKTWVQFPTQMVGGNGQLLVSAVN